MTEEWISYNNFKKQYSDNILNLLRDGLQPYNNNGEKIYCPQECHEYFHWDNYLVTHPGFTGDGKLKKQRKKISHAALKRIEKIEKAETRMGEIRSEEPNLNEYRSYHPEQFKELSWKFVWESEDSVKKKKLYSTLKNTNFKISELDKLTTTQSKVTELKLIMSDLPEEVKKHENVFFRYSKETWYVKFNGKGTTLGHLDGYILFAFLLSRPTEAFYTQAITDYLDRYRGVGKSFTREGYLNKEAMPESVNLYKSDGLSSDYPAEQLEKSRLALQSLRNRAYENIGKDEKIKELENYLRNNINIQKKLYFCKQLKEKWYVKL